MRVGDNIIIVIIYCLENLLQLSNPNFAYLHSLSLLSQQHEFIQSSKERAATAQPVREELVHDRLLGRRRSSREEK